MRFLVHELPFEQPVAAGRYTYFRDGQPTGVIESWRMTAVVDGYHILRVDLDARQAPGGESTLYHLTLNPAGQPERLNFRFFRPGRRVQGNVLFEPGRLILSRETDGNRQDGEQEILPGTLFWFPTAAGFSLLNSCRGAVSGQPAVILDREDRFTLQPVSLDVATGVPEVIAVRGVNVETQPVTIRWTGRERRLWLDAHCWPVQVQRGDLVAVTTQYARY